MKLLKLFVWTLNKNTLILPSEHWNFTLRYSWKTFGSEQGLKVKKLVTNPWRTKFLIKNYVYLSTASSLYIAKHNDIATLTWDTVISFECFDGGPLFNLAFSLPSWTVEWKKLTILQSLCCSFHTSYSELIMMTNIIIDNDYKLTEIYWI